MANKTKSIPQLPYVGSNGYTPKDLLVIVNYDNKSGTTKKTNITDYADYVKNQINFTTDNITYSGSDFDCLNIKNGMTLTDVITVIGNILCPTPQPIIRCNDLVLPLQPRGECQNPLQYIFNQSITSWCESHPPQIPCTSNVNAMDYLFDQVIESWVESHPPARPCTSDVNAMGYLFNNVINSWKNQK
jgi:hypothetical protein